MTDHSSTNHDPASPSSLVPDGRRLLRRINEMHLYVTSRCNLDCLYCSDGVKRLRGRDGQFMSLDTAQRYVDLIFLSSECDRVTVVFHGGEPTLQPVQWYRDFLSYIERMAISHRKTVDLAMQSNCRCLPSTFLGLFREKRISIGASLDGPPELNDLTRSKGEHVLRNILKLRDLGRLGGVICVLTERNCRRVGEILHFFESHGLLKVCFNVFYSVGSATVLPPLSAQQILDTYRDTYAYLKETGGRKVVERSVSIMLSKFVTPLNRDGLLYNLDCNSPFCHAGIKTVICDTEGNLFPCGCSDFPKFKLGSLEAIEPSGYMETLSMLHRKSEHYDRSCLTCFANSICSFGCPAFREEDPVTERNLCQATRDFYRFLKSEPWDVVVELTQVTREFLRSPRPT